MRRPVSPFALRLLLAVLIAATLVGTATLLIVSRRLQDQALRSGLASTKAELDAVLADAAGRAEGARAQFVLSTLLTDLGRRPDTTSVLLVDRDRHVLGFTGRLDRSAIDRAAATMDAGRTSAVLRETPERHLEFIAPVSSSYTLVVKRSAHAVDEAVDATRRSLLAVQLPGLLVLLVLVWVLGGRALSRAHTQALRLATRDGLTGLGNHRTFQEDLLSATTGGGQVALIVLDLDDFKRLNDTSGHQAGDELLRRVADRTVRTARFEDRAYRVGGDEFALLLARTTEPDAVALAGRLGRAIRTAGAHASIGVAATRPGMTDGLQLREEADAALYEAKRRREHQVMAFSSVGDDVVVRHPRKVEAMWRLVEERSLDVAFQPIWDLEHHRLVGVEALARPRPGLGIDGPAEAFDVAERAGAVSRLDRVCAEAALHAARGLPEDVLLFLNLSAETLALAGEGQWAWLSEEVARAGLTPPRVVVEVSERFGRRPAAVVAGAAVLRGAGFLLALDDVGAGEAGMARLRELDVDFIKVDREVVAGAATQPGARAVLAAVAAFATATRAFVIAEGIEDAAVLEGLRALDHDQTPRGVSIRGGQGFGLVRPQPSLEAALGAVPGLVGATTPPPAADIRPARSA